MDVNFRIGECFTTYKDLEEKLKRFVRSSWSPLYIRESRKITCTRRAPNKVVNESLVYGDLRYCCIHGGRSGDAQNRKSTNQMSCPFMMTLRADADGRYLRVTKAILEHNHPVSKEIYDQLPRRFRIRFDPEALPTPASRHKAKKKLNRHPYAMKREEVVKTEQPILPKPDNNNIAANSIHMNNRGLSNHSVPNHGLPNHGLPTQGLVNHGISNHIILDTISEAPRYPVPAPSNECHNSWSDELEGMLPPKKRRTSISNEDLHETLVSQAQQQVEREKDSDEVRGALLTYLRRHNEQDEEDRFFLSMAAIVRTLPSDVRATLKFRIHHMIFDAQMDNMSQTT
ncbi:uncharacterized protein LOC121429641 [Lytechinus variegatus]|uniref:uncharacterized protein LOC121429641 n=1 Tax=Lytechinus variegatus TaxID=7654 RepID=UPI001BB18F6C|nr:uncharacterized protein LOC121429641 [Lytechinus variegatus]